MAEGRKSWEVEGREGGESIPVMRLWAALGSGQWWERALCPANATFLMPSRGPGSVGISVVRACTSDVTCVLPMVVGWVVLTPLHWSKIGVT